MAVSVTDVQKAYLAYFGRPADYAGLNYWMNSDAATMNAGFAASTEYATLYSGMTADQRVEQVYQNLLGRASDAAGKAYWVAEFNAGRQTVSSLVTTMQANVLGVDIGTVANRVTYSILFTAQMDTPAEVVAYSGTEAANAARDAVSAVSYTDTSLAAARTTIVADTASVVAGVAPSVAAADAAADAAAAAAAAVADVSLGTVTVAQANVADAATTGVVTATISDTAAATLAGLTGTGNAYTTTIAAGAAAAADLLLINAATTVAVDAAAVTSITGNATDIAAVATAIGAGTITHAGNWNSAPTGTATVTQANTIHANNGTGTITATISDTSATTLATLTGTHAYTVAPAGAATAVELAAIDTATSVAVPLDAVTSITGTAAAVDAIATLIGAGTAMTNATGNWSTTASPLTVAQANNIDLRNGTGTITATISNDVAATLATLTGTHAYTTTIAAGAAAASDLVLIDAATTVAVGATAVTSLTGTTAEVSAAAAAIAAGTINNAAITGAGILTTATDIRIGTSGVDGFSGTFSTGNGSNTFTVGDILAGGGGDDTLTIAQTTIDQNFDPADGIWAGLTGIENIVITTTGTSVQTITTGADFKTAFTTGGVTGVNLDTTTGVGAINIDMQTTDFTGTAAIVAESTGAGVHNITTGSGAATVDSTTFTGAQNINGTGLTSVTITSTGAGVQTVGDSTLTDNLVTINATQHGAGNQVLTSTSASAVTVTVVNDGSAGNQIINTAGGDDIVNATNIGGTTNVYSTGAGNDTINLLNSGVATANSITGGTGADSIVLAINAAPDTINVAVGDSLVGVDTFDSITNFNIDNDRLDLATATIAADVAAGAGNGTDSGAFLAHTITNGLIQLFGNNDGSTGGVVIVNAANLTNAITYIATNIIAAGNTVMLQYDASGAGGYGAGDTVFVFQQGATNTLVELVGVDASALTKLGVGGFVANTVIIV